MTKSVLVVPLKLYGDICETYQEKSEEIKGITMKVGNERWKMASFSGIAVYPTMFSFQSSTTRMDMKLRDNVKVLDLTKYVEVN